MDDRDSGDEYDDEEEEEEEEQEPRKWTAHDLVLKALHALDTCEPMLAGKFFEKALEMEPNNVDVLDEYAEVLLSQDVAKASRLLQRSIALAPNGGYSKYMNLAQILEGQESVQCFWRGVELMRRDLGTVAEAGHRRALTRELSAGLVCIAELWMTDLCFEEGAEERCEQAAAQAIEADNTNADAFQVQASLRISQQRPDEAWESLMRGYSLWKAKDEADGDDGGDDEGREGMDLGEDWEDDEDKYAPSYASKLATAKMFLELAKEDACEMACDILKDLVLENEDDPELYFLLALAGDERAENLARASEKLAKAQREGETDLEHLAKAIQNALKSISQ